MSNNVSSEGMLSTTYGFCHRSIHGKGDKNFLTLFGIIAAKVDLGFEKKVSIEESHLFVRNGCWIADIILSACSAISISCIA